MSAQTAIAVAIVVILGIAQYALMIQALRDLARRPRVRSGNKVAWGLLILCVPIIGALIYGWMGPTSLLRRPEGSSRTDGRRPAQRRNVTSIDAVRRRRNASTRPPDSMSSEARSAGNRAPAPTTRRRSRTGS